MMFLVTGCDDSAGWAEMAVGLKSPGIDSGGNDRCGESDPVDLHRQYRPLSAMREEECSLLCWWGLAEAGFELAGQAILPPSRDCEGDERRSLTGCRSVAVKSHWPEGWEGAVSRSNLSQDISAGKPSRAAARRRLARDELRHVPREKESGS